MLPSLDGRRFVPVANSPDGEVDGTTVFTYHEADGVVWADYAGGQVRRGYLVGTRDGRDLDFRYAHLNVDGQTATGHCRSVISLLADGRLHLDETWQWESRAGSGTSTVEEQARWIDEVPVAHTPPGGWSGAMPPVVLGGCVDRLVDGAPDLRGIWQVAEVSVAGAPDPAHRALGMLQRIEQAGNRLVVTAGGIVHDMRCDGSELNGVHDVAEFDRATEITVVASYEDGVHVLRPVGMNVQVRRWRDGDQMVWEYLGFTARCDRVGV